MYSSDIWSLGVLLYKLATYELPFMDRDKDKHRRNIENAIYKPLPDSVSDDIREIIYKCF